MLDGDKIGEAAKALVAARQSGEPAERFPETSRPADGAEAAEIQAAVVALLGDRVAGWKVARLPDIGLIWGAIVASRTWSSGAHVPSKTVPGLGVEAEIAFRFDRDLPPREAPYDRADIETVTTPFVGLEIVDSRFHNAPSIPAVEKAADFMSNGGYVIGTPRSDWRSFDLAALKASVVVNGKPVVDRRVGGHATKDPMVLAVALANAFRTGDGIKAGQFITTGTFTGIEYAKPGDRVQAVFEGFGEAEVVLD